MINFEIIWKSLCKVPAIVDTIFTSVLSLSQVSISCNRIGNAGLVGNKLGYWLMISLYINCSSALKRYYFVYSFYLMLTICMFYYLLEKTRNCRRADRSHFVSQSQGRYGWYLLVILSLQISRHNL